MRIVDNLQGDVDFSILRFHNERNPKEDNYPSIMVSLFGLTYSYKSKDGRLLFFIANSEKDVKMVVDPTSNLKEIDISIRSYQWAYIAFSHDSKTGKGNFFAMTNTTKIKKPFYTQYTYFMRQKSVLYVGAFTEDKKDLTEGMIGDVGPIFMSDQYLENIEYYWLGSYYDAEIIGKFNFRAEYIFQTYTDVTQIIDSFRGKPALIKGPAEYDGKRGLSLPKGTYIQIDEPIEPVFKFMTTLCFFIGFEFKEPLDSEFILFLRGVAEKHNSIALVLRMKEGKRVMALKIGYITENNSPTNREFEDDRLITPDTYHEINACFGIGRDDMSSALLYLDGKVKFFDRNHDIWFDWREYSTNNTILSPNSKSEGNINLYQFSIIEGGGGVLYSQEKHAKIVSECTDTCYMPTSDIFESFKCVSCTRKPNNVNIMETKQCTTNCKSP